MASSVVGKNQAATAFNKVWRMLGKPTLSIVVPISEWVLPTGVNYSRHYDQFVDENGVAVNVDWASQPSLSSPFLTRQAPRSVRLQLPGQSTVNEMTVVLPWSSIAQERIAAAWGVNINGQIYRVRSWGCQPAGVDDPASIAVQLAEENR